MEGSWKGHHEAYRAVSKNKTEQADEASQGVNSWQTSSTEK